MWGCVARGVWLRASARAVLETAHCRCLGTLQPVLTHTRGSILCLPRGGSTPSPSPLAPLLWCVCSQALREQPNTSWTRLVLPNPTSRADASCKRVPCSVLACVSQRRHSLLVQGAATGMRPPPMMPSRHLNFGVSAQRPGGGAAALLRRTVPGAADRPRCVLTTLCAEAVALPSRALGRASVSPTP